MFYFMSRENKANVAIENLKNHDVVKEEVQNDELGTFILIDKQEMRLSLYDNKGNIVSSYPIACGKNFGNKSKRGDMKTPEGVFHICDIQNASSWEHDFKDGKGKIKGAYGPWFLRLEVPGHNGIGIHGTHKPESIGTRDTEGCIRLNNKDIETLKSKVKIGMPVIVIPSANDILADKQDVQEK